MIDVELVYQMLGQLRTTQCWVAYSGGLDSHVLLHALAGFCEKDPALELRAIHIHHGLSPQADQWSEHCLRVCNELNVACQIEKIPVREHSHRRSLEEVARDLRYQTFRRVLPANAALLLAHHSDDQSETVLLQLLRGAGVKGLAAMPQIIPFGAGLLVRPFLNQTRHDLHAYAQQHGLVCVEDESNADLRFDRNYLRRKVMPLLAERWPEMNTTVARTAQHCVEAETLLAELAAEDQTAVSGAVPGTLAITALKQLTPYRQKNVLRYWLLSRQGKMPGSATVARIQDEVLHARHDANPQLRWGKWIIRRYLDHLYALPLPSTPPNRDWETTWDGSQPLTLPGVGTLSAEQVNDSGLLIPAGSQLTVCFRRGGERFHPAGRCGSHPLKKLLHEWQVPPWRRDFIPLIYLNDCLVAVGDLATAAQYSVSDDRRGWRMLVEFNPGY